MPGKTQQQSLDSSSGDKELKMVRTAFWQVLVVRQDLKMGTGKIASQCAHASTGMYSELMQSDRSLLRRWEQCGQPKIVVTCKNQTEMDRLKEAADDIGLPTFVVADAGRTQVSAGSKTVMAVGPGPKSSVDSVTGKLRLL
ncbi:Peptidyl-tRNA hydrolase 2, mitochondrial [Linum perenne]